MIDDKIIQQWLKDFDKEVRITDKGSFIKIMAEDGEILNLDVDEYIQYRLNKHEENTNTQAD